MGQPVYARAIIVTLGLSRPSAGRESYKTKFWILDATLILKTKINLAHLTLSYELIEPHLVYSGYSRILSNRMKIKS